MTNRHFCKITHFYGPENEGLAGSSVNVSWFICSHEMYCVSTMILRLKYEMVQFLEKITASVAFL